MKKKKRKLKEAEVDRATNGADSAFNRATSKPKYTKHDDRLKDPAEKERMMGDTEEPDIFRLSDVYADIMSDVEEE